MSRKKVYIENLTDTEIILLEDGWKEGKSHDFRNRCQCILLSHQRYDVTQLSTMFSVTKHTIYEWIKNWKKYNIEGIKTKLGQGRHPKLSVTNENHVKVVEEAAKEAAEKGINMVDKVVEKLELKDGLSSRTLRRFLQKKNYAYKRLRRKPKKEIKIEELEVFIDVRKDLNILVKEGFIDIFFVDEAGFSLTPNISYAWMPIGIQWGIKSIKKKVMNVLGFLNPYNDHLKIYPLPEKTYMDSALFIKCVNDFVTGINKETVLVLDRAPWHTSELTLSKIPDWEKQGLHIVFLPAYAPHYNLIETLWRKVKNEWLKIKDYHSKTSLKKKLNEIFKEYGNIYNIKFSMNF